jgi:hypothetical protein
MISPSVQKEAKVNGAFPKSKKRPIQPLRVLSPPPFPRLHSLLSSALVSIVRHNSSSLRKLAPPGLRKFKANVDVYQLCLAPRLAGDLDEWDSTDFYAVNDWGVDCVLLMHHIPDTVSSKAEERQIKSDSPAA